jgi:hypothetical protein
MHVNNTRRVTDWLRMAFESFCGGTMNLEKVEIEPTSVDNVFVINVGSDKAFEVTVQDVSHG